jgi:hypothetical protein
VTYSDADANLPWKRTVELCDSGTDNCNSAIDMIPDGHTYEDGVTFSASLNGVADGNYDAHLWFADDDIANYPNPQITQPPPASPIVIGSVI